MANRVTCSTNLLSISLLVFDKFLNLLTYTCNLVNYEKDFASCSVGCADANSG